LNLTSPTDISGDLVGAFRRAKDLAGQLIDVWADDPGRVAMLADADPRGEPRRGRGRRLIGRAIGRSRTTGGHQHGMRHCGDVEPDRHHDEQSVAPDPYAA
jgi:hypothetical protein